MRLRALLFATAALAGVGLGAHRLAEVAVAGVERTTRDQLSEALTAAGEDWARAQVDGLIVRLEGAAPDEAGRLRAIEIVRRVVDPRRVTDATTLAAAAPLAPPPFALELLRNEDEVSLIGLAPEGAGGAAIVAALDDAGLGGAVSDMLESVDQPAPPGWEAALGFALDALGDLPRAKISVAPGAVAISALAETDAARGEIAAALEAARPEGVALTLDIVAPRPVIAPFRAEVALVDGVARFRACSAETPEQVATIAAAAGLARLDCALGLGAPSPDWAAAVVAGLDALRALGGGRFALDDIAATLDGPAGVDVARLKSVGDALAARLPEVFSLAVVAPPQMAATPGGAVVYAPRFDAFLLDDGSLRLAGPLQDETARAAVVGFAQALFGAARVQDATVVDPNLPDGWPGRVLAGVEALALMRTGKLSISGDLVDLEGWALEADGAQKAAEIFAAKAVGAAEVEVRFDAVAAALAEKAAAAAADPVGACRDAVEAARAGRTIAFEPGEATLEASGADVVADIAAAMQDCPPVDFEIAGHTDSQGGAEANQTLSEARAETVKAALEATGLPLLRFVAVGYGAERPVADNDTDEGRARNRRIDFTLIEPAPVGEGDAALEPDRAPRTAGTATEPYLGPR